MDAKYLTRFLESIPRMDPVQARFADWLRLPNHSLRIVQPLEAKQRKNTNMGFDLIAKSNINASQQILLLSSEKCLTNIELVGCTTSKAYELQTTTSVIANKRYGHNTNQVYYAQGLLKLIIQLFVHSQDKQQFLSPYTQFIMKEQIRSPLFWQKETYADLYSTGMLKIIQNTRQQVQTLSDDFKEHRIFGMSDDVLTHIFQTVRRNTICFTPQFPRHFNGSSVLMTAPLISHMSHSFEPNCVIDGCFLSHENQSFVRLSSLRAINTDETLTINFSNLSNHDLLMRYGFMQDNNIYNQMTIELDFASHFKLANEMFDYKQKLFRLSDIQDIETQAIYRNKINVDLLKYLRIYFLSEQDIKDNYKISSFVYEDFNKQISKANELIVFQFLQENLQRILDQYQKNKIRTLNYRNIKTSQIDPSIELKLTNLKDLEQIKIGEYRDMLQICLEEEEILQNNIKFVKQNIDSI